MTDFVIQRNRRGHFIGFSISGFSVKSWEELEGLANALIARNSDSWGEMWVDDEELATEYERLHQLALEGLKAEIDKQKQVNLELTKMIYLQAQLNKDTLEDNRQLIERARNDRNELTRLRGDYDSYKKAAEQEYRSLKAEIITSLRAINLCLVASITTKNQPLTHRQRNFRMQHVNQIISNEIDRFADCKITTYEDDF